MGTGPGGRAALGARSRCSVLGLAGREGRICAGTGDGTLGGIT